MKQIRFLKWGLGLVLWVAISAFAADTLHFESRPGSKVKVEGSSTVHDWAVESLAIKGFMDVPANFAKDPAGAAKNIKAEVTIPVRSLKSDKSAMNNIMWEAMKMKEHPNIEYKLLELTPKSGATQGSAQFEAKGTLTVSGVTRTNVMPVTIEKVDDTKAKVTGTTGVKMTEFGIKPPAPTVGLGFIKTYDDVKITVQWLTEQAPAAAKTADAAK
ncbi:MAG TPA: YceI family protein [Candidatus Binatia bacterium]|nr:YceI family protein [Candidatus Binatia bacterium]